jgi:SAM-dependent methyltransferase
MKGMDIVFYDSDYYERGIETGKSCYSNYRWMPEQTFAMAMTIIDYLNIKRGDTVLDFGCSKGFLVKALNILYRDAWGVDVSNYAIEQCDSQVKNKCILKSNEPLMDSWQIANYPKMFDFCIAKDVFEHIEQDDLRQTLLSINANQMLAIVPLGEDGIYRAPSNNMDQSHVICENEYWWASLFECNGWRLKKITLKIPGIKDSYYDKYPTSHGFFILGKQ